MAIFTVHHYQNHTLYIEQSAIPEIITQYGTPLYLYSKAQILKNWQDFQQALTLTKLNYKIFYAVKANSNLSLLRLLGALGAGFDTVSQGEIQRVIQATGNAHNVVFSGIGKTTEEISFALQAGIHCFNVESRAELMAIAKIANNLNLIAPIALRINPDIKVITHPHITTGSKNNKFGIPITEVETVYAMAKTIPELNILGLTCHLGSQILDLQTFNLATRQLCEFAKKNNLNLQHLNLGGGLGIAYTTETAPSPAEYIQAIAQAFNLSNSSLYLEPGRALIGNAGYLITKVTYLKSTPHKNFAIIDAAMNDLMRPALYNSQHKIIPVMLTNTIAPNNYDIVGPICESADCFAKDFAMAVNTGDLLAITNTGAYGFSMSSNYNSRPRCAEVLVDGEKLLLIRQRETLADLYRHELG